MPTYEYACQACEHRFEIWQKMSDDPLTVCPQCGGHIRRVLFPAGIVFKGHGFYKTDYNGSSSSPVSTNGNGSLKSEKGESSSSANGTSETASSSNGASTSSKSSTETISSARESA